MSMRSPCSIAYRQPRRDERLHWETGARFAIPFRRLRKCGRPRCRAKLSFLFVAPGKPGPEDSNCTCVCGMKVPHRGDLDPLRQWASRSSLCRLCDAIIVSQTTWCFPPGVERSERVARRDSEPPGIRVPDLGRTAPAGDHSAVTPCCVTATVIGCSVPPVGFHGLKPDTPRCLPARAQGRKQACRTRDAVLVPGSGDTTQGDASPLDRTPHVTQRSC
jgi:hypothetical protein